MKTTLFKIPLLGIFVLLLGGTLVNDLNAQEQFTATPLVTLPTESYSDPGYNPNGLINITVSNFPGCAGTYTVNATPLAGSGPEASTPPGTSVQTYIGFPEGSNFNFANAGYGIYRLTITQTAVSPGTCTPTTNPVVFDVFVCEPISTTDVAVNQSQDQAGPGVCEAEFSWIEPTFTGGCNITVTRTLTPAPPAGVSPGAYSPGQNVSAEILAGVTTVTYEATDGNTTEIFEFTLTLVETEDPIITFCGTPAASYDADIDECFATLDETDFGGVATATTNCGTTPDPVITYSLDASGTPAIAFPYEFPVGTSTVYVTATDLNDNTATCNFDVVVTENIPPVISCPADISVFTEPGMCERAVSFANPSFIDNCSTEVTFVQTEGPSSGSLFPIGTTTVSFDVIDGSGNTSSCSFTVTVEDNEDPVAVCMDITIELDANGEATITAEDLDGGSTDNCSGEGLNFTASQTDFDCSHTGENTITFTVTDQQGNSSTCTAIVTVVDTIAPEAFCVAPFTIELDADGTASITAADIDAGSTDNCEITLTLSQSTFTCADLGENEITLTVTDASGNVTTCMTTVTVTDDIAPVASCMDFTLELGEDGTATLLPEDIGGESTDNCGITVTSVNIDTFDCSDIGTTVMVTYFATDASGNVSSCTAMVTIVDLLPPVITCPEDFEVNVEANGTYILEDFIASGVVSATDNCTDPVEGIVQSPAAGTLLGVGTYSISFTAEDAFGNEGVCTFELTVSPFLSNADLSFNSLTMYPNPAATTVQVGNPKMMNIDQISIYDIKGRLVIQQQFSTSQNTYTLDVSNLSPAVYMVMIQGDNKQTAKRLIVK